MSRQKKVYIVAVVVTLALLGGIFCSRMLSKETEAPKGVFVCL